MPESFPTTFGRYTLIERLGMGGMAEVFLAEVAGPASFSKRVVVKRLLPELTSDREVVARFLEEARLSAKFSHPNIVQVFELGDVDGDYFIAMEHVAGADLRRIERLLWPSRAEVPIGIAAAVAAAVCRGLDHVHCLTENGTPLGIVHRDVSPSNVLLSFEGGVKLIDFGVARAHAHARITRQGTAIMGKLVYASPEQVLGLPVTPRSDLFSAGCLLYEALTGVRPFERETEPATLHAITRETARPPRELRDAVPAALDEVVMRALARNPADRWPTAGQMAQALESLVAERGQLIGTPQIGAFVRAALEDQDALTVTRMGDPKVEREMRGGSTPASSPAAPLPPPGLEELPTIVETGAAAPVQAPLAAAAPARRRASSVRSPEVPGPSDWDAPEPERAPSAPPGLEEELPTTVQGASGGEPPAPARPRPASLGGPGPVQAPPGLEELSTAVVPPESVAVLAASMDTVTPDPGRRRDFTLQGFGTAAPPRPGPSRPLFGVPDHMPSDTVIETESGASEGDGREREGESSTTESGLTDVAEDLPAEPTRIDGSMGEAARAAYAHASDEVSTDPGPGREPPPARPRPLDDEEDELSTGAGLVQPPIVVDERARMAYAPTVAVGAFAVQPGNPIVPAADASSVVATFAIVPPGAAPLLHIADASTAAPTTSAVGPLSASPGSDGAMAPAPAPAIPLLAHGRAWLEPEGAHAAARRPIPTVFLAIAGAMAVLTALIVVLVLSTGDEPTPVVPRTMPVPGAPAPSGASSPGTLGQPPSAPPSHSVAPPGPSAPPAPTPPAPAVPTPPAPTAPTPPSSAVSPSPAPAPAPARPATGPRGSAKRRDVGRLRLTSNPRGVVEIDGVRAGSTPLRGYPLEAGTHRIRIVNERAGRSATIAVKIRAGRVISRSVRLRRNPTLPHR